jgi:ATP-binding cassette subfamily F protein uup
LCTVLKKLNFPGNYAGFRAYEDSKTPEPKVEKTAAVKREKTPQKGKLSYNEKREFGILEIDIEKLQKKNVGLSCL